MPESVDLLGSVLAQSIRLLWCTFFEPVLIFFYVKGERSRRSYDDYLVESGTSRSRFDLPSFFVFCFIEIVGGYIAE